MRSDVAYEAVRHAEGDEGLDQHGHGEKRCKQTQRVGSEEPCDEDRDDEPRSLGERSDQEERTGIPENAPGDADGSGRHDVEAYRSPASVRLPVTQDLYRGLDEYFQVQR